MLKVKRTACLLLMATMHMMTWVSATKMPLTPLVAVTHHQDKDQILQSPQVHPFVSKQGVEDMEKYSKRKEEAYRGLGRLGSRPPNCEHKCRDCVPCAAIQVPTTTDNLGLQYANYEPEGWKCKCGSSYFNP